MFLVVLARGKDRVSGLLRVLVLFKSLRLLESFGRASLALR
jgi:hypothetical protein